VASRTSAFAFKGKPADVGEIGTKLKVATVLEGSVRRDGPRVRLTAQLVDVANGYHLWSQTYEREMKDVFAVEAELARSIAATLRPRLFPRGALDRAPTQNPEAHDLYLRGRHFWNQRTVEGLNKAISLFQQAIQQDERYALAYVGLADSYVLLVDYANAPRMEMLAKGRPAVLRALEIDETSAEAHATLGLVREYELDWRGAGVEFRRALELNPGYATAHQWYSDALAWTGRLEEALSEAKLALHLDPNSIAINSQVVYIYLCQGQYDRAIEQARRTLELKPDAVGPHVLLGLVYWKQGKAADSLAEFEIVNRVAPPGDFAGLVGVVYVANGKLAEALRLRSTYDGPYKKFVRGLIDMAMGDLDAAFANLDAAIDADDYPQFNLKVGPIFDPLRSDPRFTKLLKKMNAE
jgi:tetratricopeptide (TPR) repeat protein